ncbi:hypothetical protein BDW68DRAFT_179132 [Aspergillus falconensis]
MLIYLGKLNYSPYAANEIFSVTFPENVKSGDRVVVIHQWTKDAAGVERKNSFAEGTINKAVDIRQGVKEIEFFEKEKDKTYYWYKGTISGDTVTLIMMNKKGEECAKNIKLELAYF